MCTEDSDFWRSPLSLMSKGMGWDGGGRTLRKKVHGVCDRGSEFREKPKLIPNKLFLLEDVSSHLEALRMVMFSHC